jgi:uncharacterized protein
MATSYQSPGVYLEEFEIGAKPIEGVSTSTTGFVGTAESGPLDTPFPITSWSAFTQTFGWYNKDTAPFLAPAVYGFFLNGGSTCYVVRVELKKEDAGDDLSNYIGTEGQAGARTGLWALSDIEDVRLVCIPGITDLTVQTSMIAYCEKLQDRFCILDSAKGASMQAVTAQADVLSSDKGYAALYYPWIRVPIEYLATRKVGNTQVDKSQVSTVVDFVPPSGYVAGIYARTDGQRGVHKAPANESVLDAQQLELTITKADQDTLNPKNVNCIRAFSGRGIRVWGARTLNSDPLWKYVNVRRLFIYLEESINRGIQWVVFEPNDAPLWARARQSISQFLRTEWRNGALMGATEDEAFFVKCDRTTMTQADIDNGLLRCIIGVAPVKPAEFVIIRIAQWTAGAKS